MVRGDGMGTVAKAAQDAAVSSAKGAPGLAREPGGRGEHGAGAGERQQQQHDAEQHVGC